MTIPERPLDAPAEEPSTSAILIVDDTPENIQVLANLLKPLGHDLAFATNGPDALDSVAHGHFDLLLLDVMMPGMDGFEVCRRLREEIGAADLPVIFLTARADADSILKGFAVGGVDYLTKPFHPPELLARVSTQLRLVRARRELARRNQALAEEIERRRAAERELWYLYQQHRTFLDNIEDMACIRGLDGVPAMLNPAYDRIAGLTVADAEGAERGRGLDWRERVHPEDLAALEALFAAHPQGMPLIETEYRLRGADQWRWIQARMVGMRDPDGGYRGYYCIERDITEQRRAIQQRIDHLTHHDALTALPNRARFEEQIAERLQQAGGRAGRLALLVIGLDRFHKVNETLGHAVADGLLRTVAHRIGQQMRKDDLMARTGDDQFAILLPEIADAEQAARAAQHILEALAQPCRIEGYSLVLQGSVGIGLYPDHGEEAGLLLKNAGVAMLHARRQGGQDHRFFDQEMTRHAWQHILLEADLREAISARQLVLLLQPQVELLSGRIVGAEVLVRWQHPTHGLLTPDRFIPLAEENGLIVPMTEAILRQALGMLEDWQGSGRKSPRLAINLSGVHFRRREMAAEIGAILRERPIDPALIEFEITESALMEEMEQGVATLNALRDLGCQLALDDFGTGFSSLSYLNRLPIHKLKIDRAFIRDLPTDHSSARITRAILELSHGLGLRSIAEGIESEAHLELLRAAGCNEGQGYLFDRPLSRADFEQRLHAAR